MCLSTVYKGNTADANKLLEYVTNIDVNAETGSLRLYDITGDVKDIQGKLQSVDLIKNIILVDLE
jgi:predicted RNA-binding protein